MKDSRLRLAIIGAGPSGCCLAKLLINANLDVTVFEGEASFKVRSQGGTLDLHVETGQKALRRAGLFDEFLKVARYDGEALTLLDKHGTVYLRTPGSGDQKSSRGRPEIDRGQLRRILIESLPEGVILWGYRLRSVDPDTLDLHFDQGIEREFDLLIGADGTWSKVRPVLTSTRPYYVGLGGYSMVVRDCKDKHSDMHKMVRQGSIFAFSDGKGLTLQQQGDGNIHVYTHQVRDEKWMEDSEYDVSDAAAVKRALEKDFADWRADLTECLRVADNETVRPSSLFQLPVGTQWEAKPRVTLIGDAAHVCTPFAGEGVNLALDDAVRLAEGIINANMKTDSDPKILADTIRTYELDMFARSSDISELSRRQMELMFFTKGAPRTSVARWIRRALAGTAEERWWYKVLLPLWLINLILRICRFFFWSR